MSETAKQLHLASKIDELKNVREEVMSVNQCPEQTSAHGVKSDPLLVTYNLCDQEDLKAVLKQILNSQLKNIETLVENIPSVLMNKLSIRREDRKNDIVIEELTNKLETLMRDNTVIKNKLKTLEDENTEMKDKLENFERLKMTLVDETKILYVENTKIKDKLRILEVKSTDIKDKLESFEIMNATMEDELKRFDDENTKIKEKLVGLEDRNTEMEDKLIALEDEDTEMKDKLNSLKSMNSKIEATVLDILRSERVKIKHNILIQDQDKTISTLRQEMNKEREETKAILQELQQRRAKEALEVQNLQKQIGYIG